jgi:DNA-directed RNA polymerase specialized sigma24 family protein
VADIFLTLLQHESPFETKGKLEYFLYTTARNISVDYMRHQKVVKDKSSEVADYYLSLEEDDVEGAETGRLARSWKP